MYGAVFFLPLTILIMWVVSVLFISTGGHYSQGIVSFVPSPDGEYVFVTRAKNVLTTSGLILDKHGGLVVDCGKGAGCLNPDLTWRPGPEKGWVLYWEGMASGAFARRAKSEPRMVLYNINTHDSLNIEYPKAETEDCFVNYMKWGNDGSCLFGTETNTAEGNWTLGAVFRHNVISGEHDEFEIPQPGSHRSACKLLPAQNKAILYMEYEEDAGEQRFTVLDMASFEEKTYELEEKVTQWEMAADGKTLIVLEKIFGDNIVSYRLVTRNMEDDGQKVLLESPILPQYSFEDAARGKAVYTSFQISPACKWVVCNSTAEERKEEYYLVNPSEKGFCRLLEWDSDKHYVSFTFSPDETRLGALYSPRYDYDPNELDEAKLEIYDISGTEAEKVAALAVDESLFSYKFLGNERILYIKRSDEDYRWWKNTNELWAINVADGSQEPFVSRKSSENE
jgi:hypothetical protein